MATKAAGGVIRDAEHRRYGFVAALKRPITPIVIEGDLEPADLSRSQPPGPWLVLAEPIDGARQKQPFSPFGEPDLLDRFAAIRTEGDAEAFANECGWLGVKRELLRGEAQRGEGESIPQWLAQADEVRLVRDLWRFVLTEDRETLGAFVFWDTEPDPRSGALLVDVARVRVWTRDGELDADFARQQRYGTGALPRIDAEGIFVPADADPEEVALRRRQIEEANRAVEEAGELFRVSQGARKFADESYRDPDTLAGWAAEDVVEPMRKMLCNLATNALREHVHPTVIPQRENGGIVYQAESLLSAIWAMVAMEIAGIADDAGGKPCAWKTEDGRPGGCLRTVPRGRQEFCAYHQPLNDARRQQRYRDAHQEELNAKRRKPNAALI